MRKLGQSSTLFLVAALLFLVVAAFSERPAIYISLGAVFLILGFASRRKAARIPPSDG